MLPLVKALRTSEDLTMSRPIVIHADWDPDAAVWVATTQDLRGLVTEAESIEALRAKLPGMILDLLEENGISDLPASIEIIARASDRLIAAE
jgi:predicted RNase H-like HicB family nuclease